MEDIPKVYYRPHNPLQPLDCLDEGTKQQVQESRPPLPAQPGQRARYDYEYTRLGTSNLFMRFTRLERGDISRSLTAADGSFVPRRCAASWICIFPGAANCAGDGQPQHP
jgi:hypothetical protein